MLNKIIKYFLENKLVTVLILITLITRGVATSPFNWDTGFLSKDPIPVDAIPDIGEHQQIVFTQWAGRSPQDIEDQISYPMTIVGVNMSLFTGESHTVWMDLNSDLKNTLQHVQHHKNLREVRKNFHQLSDTMTRLEMSFNANYETLYVFHCPMANNSKGADWLSTSKEVKNPYYGQSMLTCGEFTKEIK